MASPTMQPREPHTENERSFSSDPSNMHPESTTSAGPARLPPPGSKHRLTADGKVRSVEAAQALDDLEAETGFASYAAYFESLRYNPAYSGLSWQEFMRDREFSHDAKNHCTIIDLYKEETSPPKANLRCENLTAVQALQSLRRPPKDVAVQIVFWSFDNRSSPILDPDFVTVLGLGLKLDPCFFQAFAATPSSDVLNERAVNERSLPEYFFVAGTIVAIARDCALAKPGTAPILLIAALDRLDYHVETDTLYYLIREAPPTLTLGTSQPNKGDPRLYAWLLTISMNQNPDCTISCEALLFGSLLPLLQLDILRMRTRCSYARSTFRRQKNRAFEPILDEFGIGRLSALGAHESTFEVLGSAFEHTADTRLYRYRVLLRSLIETFDGLTEPLVRFISSQLAPELKASPAYNRIAEERGLLLKEAISLEAEIRDFLQLEAGQLSLLESRRSIEVSNNQLLEGKRVKVFTILAFIYVPFNLATGIFGMNLQQLNGSGKNVGYFVGTALIALIITGGSWWLTEQLSTLRAWRKRDRESYDGPMISKAYDRAPPNYSILVRAAMLAWLVTHGHWYWMVQSGAGWCTLTNSRRRYRPYFGSSFAGYYAGDYLSRFIRPNYEPRAFGLITGRWEDLEPPKASHRATPDHNPSLSGDSV